MKNRKIRETREIPEIREIPEKLDGPVDPENVKEYAPTVVNLVNVTIDVDVLAEVDHETVAGVEAEAEVQAMGGGVIEEDVRFPDLAVGAAAVAQAMEGAIEDLVQDHAQGHGQDLEVVVSKSLW